MQKSPTSLIAVAFMALLIANGSVAGQAWFYEPLGTVGPLGKVGPLGTVGKIGTDGFALDLPDGLRGKRDTVYIDIWSWSATQDTRWRATGKYDENPYHAFQFASYQNLRYEYHNGKAFIIPVFKKDWDDLETRKKIMERIKSEAIPAFLEQLAKQREIAEPELAALLRKKIQFVKMAWVDVKPYLPEDSKEYKDLKASKVEASKKIGFDDETKTTKLEGSTWAMEIEKRQKYHFGNSNILTLTVPSGNSYKGTWKQSESDVVITYNEGSARLEGRLSDDNKKLLMTANDRNRTKVTLIPSE